MGNAELAQANKWTRFLTTIRQIFGNLFRSSHRETFQKILTDHVIPKNPQQQTVEIYKNLVKKLKEKEIQNKISPIFQEAENVSKENVKTGEAKEPSDATKKAIEELEEIEELKNFLNLCKHDEGESTWIINELRKNHPKVLKQLSFCFDLPKHIVIPMEKELFSLAVKLIEKHPQVFLKDFKA